MNSPEQLAVYFEKYCQQFNVVPSIVTLNELHEELWHLSNEFMRDTVALLVVQKILPADSSWEDCPS